jgi:two-component system, LytTR family, response regulator AlgR
LERRKLADSDEEGSEIGWAVQVAATGEWLAVSRRQASAVRDALEQA